MDTRNLAIVFGIFGDDDPKGGDLLSLQAHNVSRSMLETSRMLNFSLAGIGYVHGIFNHSLAYNIR